MGKYGNYIVLAYMWVLVQYVETLLENIKIDGREQVYISHEFYFKACLNLGNFKENAHENSLLKQR